jgi:hypothetical protein
MTELRSRDDLPLKEVAPADRTADPHLYDHRLERLLDRMPERWRNTMRRLRHPSARWVRIPAAALLILGGVLSILPILGLWMLPLGLILLAEDIPALHRCRARLLAWIERRRPHWFAADRSIDIPKSQRLTSQGDLT